MITSIFIYIIGAIIGIMLSLLSLLSPASGILYPPEFLASFQMFGQSLASINFFWNTYELARAICFLIQFFTYYFSAFLIIFIIKRVRGG
jgi:hypothetical protein